MNAIGLCSMSFPNDSVETVIEICKRTQVEVVEWSGRDYHLPPGTPEAMVREVAAACRNAGIELPSYGSYHGVFNDEPEQFAAQLDVAEALGCDTIRVWSSHYADPGEMDEITPAQVDRLVERTAAVAGMGARRGIKVAFEYHNSTPTCGADEVLLVLQRAGHANMYTYFQMLEESRRNVDQQVADLERVYPRMLNVHCHWYRDEETIGTLREGAHLWRPLLGKLVELGYEGPLYLEYYSGYSETQLVEDLAFLHEEISRLRG